MGLTGDKLSRFLTKVSATTIANQSILKCQLAGLPLTTDNVILFVGDFFDPTDEDFIDLVPEIERAIEDVVDLPFISKNDS